MQKKNWPVSLVMADESESYFRLNKNKKIKRLPSDVNLL